MASDGEIEIRDITETQWKSIFDSSLVASVSYNLEEILTKYLAVQKVTTQSPSPSSEDPAAAWKAKYQRLRPKKLTLGVLIEKCFGKDQSHTSESAVNELRNKILHFGEHEPRLAFALKQDGTLDERADFIKHYKKIIEGGSIVEEACQYEKTDQQTEDGLIEDWKYKYLEPTRLPQGSQVQKDINRLLSSIETMKVEREIESKEFENKSKKIIKDLQEGPTGENEAGSEIIGDLQGSVIEQSGGSTSATQVATATRHTSNSEKVVKQSGTLSHLFAELPPENNDVQQNPNTLNTGPSQAEGKPNPLKKKQKGQNRAGLDKDMENTATPDTDGQKSSDTELTSVSTGTTPVTGAIGNTISSFSEVVVGKKRMENVATPNPIISQAEGKTKTPKRKTI